MLELRRTALFSPSYEAVRRGVVVGRLEHVLLGASARIDVGGRQLQVWHRGFLTDRFVLREGMHTLLEASQRGVMDSTLEWQEGGHAYTMARVSFFDATQLVTRDGPGVGEIRPRTGWRSGVTVILPDGVPIEVQIFLGWIALLRRQGRTVATTS